MIRSYRKTDDDTIVNIWYKATTIAHPFMTEEFKALEATRTREMYLPNTETWVYEEGGQAIAFIAMMGNEIGGLFALPEQQRKGIGRQLVDHVKEKYPTLEVEVFKENTIGRGFYDRYGFKFMHEYIHEETGHPLLRLQYLPE